jgi:hypothetical protein
MKSIGDSKFSEIDDGDDFIRKVFVGEPSEIPERLEQQPEISGTTTVGAVESGPDKPGDYLHLYYDGDKELLLLRWVEADSDGSFPSEKGTIANQNESYSWRATGEELRRVLLNNPDEIPDPSDVDEDGFGSGFDRELRKALFMDRDQAKVRNLI